MKSLLLLCALARLAAADTVTGVVVDGARQPLASVRVRVIGESFVVLARTDPGGYFRVANLPAGHYRVAPERGELRGDAGEPWQRPAPMRIDHQYIRCCPCAMDRRQFSVPLAAPVSSQQHVDTHSTQQGITIARPGW